jgi:urocanate hydratase
MISFADEIQQGIPTVLPAAKAWDPAVNHAPKRKEILSPQEKKLALRNALRYFPKAQHAELAPEFAQELATYGRIYMYRFMPEHPIYARPISEYPGKSQQARSIMLMIQNNLDHRVAQHPHELNPLKYLPMVFTSKLSEQLKTTHLIYKALLKSLIVSVFPVPAGPAGFPPK